VKINDLTPAVNKWVERGRTANSSGPRSAKSPCFVAILRGVTEEPRRITRTFYDLQFFWSEILKHVTVLGCPSRLHDREAMNWYFGCFGYIL
jgi:hypothetical protein